MEITPKEATRHGECREKAIEFFLADREKRNRMKEADLEEMTEAFFHIWKCWTEECGNCWQKLNDDSREKKDHEMQLWLHNWDDLSPLYNMLAL